MAENSAIEWTDHTFNPWIGCTRISPGCDHCYAADLSEARLGVRWGPGQPRRHTAASTWNQPRTWDRRAAKLRIRYRVFCASLADIFDNEVPAEWRGELFALIRETPNLDWLLVTKRIGNAEKMAQAAGGWPENVWLGATIVNQAEAERDIPKLAAIRGPEYRFLSMEPLLGPVNLEPHLLYQPCPNSLDGLSQDPSTGAYECCSRCDWTAISEELALDWIIVGGESGPNARPMHPNWARSLRDQCAAAGVPFLFKQWGHWAPLLSAATVDWPATNVAWPDGHVGAGSPRANGGKGEQLYQAAKKVAGRTLDGALHDARPDRA